MISSGKYQYSFKRIRYDWLEKPFDVILPGGTFFYTFQELSYTMDAYREKLKPEKNLFKYALFVSFIPQLVSGPIERSTNLLKQINTVPYKKLFNLQRISNDLVMMLLLWGLFLKIVISDRGAVLVNTVFDSYYIYLSSVNKKISVPWLIKQAS